MTYLKKFQPNLMGFQQSLTLLQHQGPLLGLLWEIAMKAGLRPLARSSLRPLSSTSFPNLLQILKPQLLIIAEKVKAAIARPNAAPIATMPTLVVVAMQDFYGTSMAGKRKEKQIASICLHVSKLKIKFSSEQPKFVRKTTTASKFISTSYPNAFLTTLFENSLAPEEIEKKFGLSSCWKERDFY